MLGAVAVGVTHYLLALDPCTLPLLPCREHKVRPTLLQSEKGWRPSLAQLDTADPDGGGGGGTGGGGADVLSEAPPMHNTRLLELSLRCANHPVGIYCHRACCEHLVFIRDVRR